MKLGSAAVRRSPWASVVLEGLRVRDLRNPKKRGEREGDHREGKESGPPVRADTRTGRVSAVAGVSRESRQRYERAHTHETAGTASSGAGTLRISVEPIGNLRAEAGVLRFKPLGLRHLMIPFLSCRRLKQLL